MRADPKHRECCPGNGDHRAANRRSPAGSPLRLQTGTAANNFLQPPLRHAIKPRGSHPALML